MRRRQGRVNRWVLVALAAVSVLLLVAVTRSARPVRSRLYEPKLAGAQLSAQAFALVRAHRAKLGIPIDSVNDPNGSGLIGLHSSHLTHGRGDLSDALTTTNPNFSAALVEMLHKAGARAGDTIGISWDATYPALNLAVLAVARVMGLVPVIVSALSSGPWGANYPGLTWPDIERLIVRAGLWEFRSSWATLGGDNDAGQGLSPEGRTTLTAAAESSGVQLVAPESLAHGAALRAQTFRTVRLLISIGRAVADLGDSKARLPSRLLTGRNAAKASLGGTIRTLLHRGVPVVRIGNPSQVAIDYHLPVVPARTPELGKGRLFHERRYAVAMSAAFSLVLLALLGLIVRYDVESYFGVKGETGEKEAV